MLGYFSTREKWLAVFWAIQWFFTMISPCGSLVFVIGVTSLVSLSKSHKTNSYAQNKAFLTEQVCVPYCQTARNFPKPCRPAWSDRSCVSPVLPPQRNFSLPLFQELVYQRCRSWKGVQFIVKLNTVSYTLSINLKVLPLRRTIFLEEYGIFKSVNCMLFIWSKSITYGKNPSDSYFPSKWQTVQLAFVFA